MLRVGAIQLEPVVADVEANLESAQRLVGEAVREGASWVMLPEFFTTGMGFVPDLAGCALPPDGVAVALMRSLASEHGITLGGSFLCQDPDGDVRNAFFLIDATGVLGRHDKDIPTMWENCFYVGGSDDGVIDAGEYTVGAALCLEFNRYRTVRRLLGRVQFVVGGSFIWGLPPPARDLAPLKRRNETMVDWTPRFARQLGVPVVEANVTGRLDCPLPWMPTPIRYRGRLGRSAMITDGQGAVLAERPSEAGQGVVVAEIEPATLGEAPSPVPTPDRFWIERLDPVSALAWSMQNRHGRRWYTHHRAARTPAV